MKVLGIGGGLDRIYENNVTFPYDMAHDAAAVLVEDGKVIAAIEEERLTRVKHTNKAPVSAIRFCLTDSGTSMDEIDRLAVYGSEAFLNQTLRRIQLQQSGSIHSNMDIRTYTQHLIKEEFQCEFEADKIIFVPHHLTHAVSAFSMSGFDRSLVLTIDGQGDGVSGVVWNAEGSRMEELQTFDQGNSLGFFYMDVIKFLGYGMFDEYKVMGLAPYGDPRKYRRLFKKFYSLLPEGQYKIHPHHILSLYQFLTPRQRDEPFNQIHKDLAASLQEALEEIIFHILTYFRQTTGHTRLCLAGGVAHNCTVNGKILYSGLFEHMFIQPAAHDAGSALGAALHVYHQGNSNMPRNQLEHVYWGSDIGNSDQIQCALNDWSDWLEIEHSDEIEKLASTYISEGNVIGWVQGKSEFGPRALGNRSIVADPRPQENREIINAMVKMREGYRPFAPSILEEDIQEYYDVSPHQIQFPYMNYVLRVKEDKRDLLGAVTHVDGSARVQTVSPNTNPRYWKLIHAFKELTGTPILLNTSFNNNVEPIVNSINDAVVCYLTTKLDYLVVGDYFIRRKQITHKHFLNMIPSLPPYGKLQFTKQFHSATKESDDYSIGYSYNNTYKAQVSPMSYEILMKMNGVLMMEQLINEVNAVEHTEQILDEVNVLWGKRLLLLRPSQIGGNYHE